MMILKPINNKTDLKAAKNIKDKLDKIDGFTLPVFYKKKKLKGYRAKLINSVLSFNKTLNLPSEAKGKPIVVHAEKGIFIDCGDALLVKGEQV